MVDSTGVVNQLRREWCGRHSVSLDDVLEITSGRRNIGIISQVGPHLDPFHEAQYFSEREASDLDTIAKILGAAALFRSLPKYRWCVVTCVSHALTVARINAARLPNSNVLISWDDVCEGKRSPERFSKGATSLGVSARDCVIFKGAAPGIEAGLRSGAVVSGVNAIHSGASINLDPHISNFRHLNGTALSDGIIEIVWQQNMTTNLA